MYYCNILFFCGFNCYFSFDVLYFFCFPQFLNGKVVSSNFCQSSFHVSFQQMRIKNYNKILTKDDKKPENWIKMLFTLKLGCLNCLSLYLSKIICLVNPWCSLWSLALKCMFSFLLENWIKLPLIPVQLISFWFEHCSIDALRTLLNFRFML